MFLWGHRHSGADCRMLYCVLLLRLKFLCHRQRFPSLAIGVVSVGDNHKRPRVGLLDFRFNDVGLLIVHHKHKHLLVALRVESRTLYACAGAVKVVKDIFVERGEFLVTDNKQQFVILRTGNCERHHTRRHEMAISE